MTLDRLIEGYRLYCQAEGKSRHTIRWYMGKLALFQEYLHRPGYDNADEISSDAIRAFVVHLQESVRADELNPRKPASAELLSPQTIQGYVRTIKAFFSWAHREGLISHNPTARVKVPKAPATVVPTLTESQVRQFLSAIDLKQPTGFRDYCIVLTFLDTGIRLSELVGLELPALDLEGGIVGFWERGLRRELSPSAPACRRRSGNTSTTAGRNQCI